MNIQERAFEALIKTLDDEIARLENKAEQEWKLFDILCTICAEKVDEEYLLNVLKNSVKNNDLNMDKVKDFIIAVERDGLWETYRNS